MRDGTPPVIDSRGWTGPEPSPPPLDRRAARAAFLAAGGPGAAVPLRAASAISWIGLALLPLVILIGPPDRAARIPGLGPAAAAMRGELETRLVPLLGPKGAEGMADLLGDPRLLAALLALAGALVGAALAWRHRAALARGFAAAEAGVPGAVFLPHRFGEVAPFFLLYVAFRPSEGWFLALDALLLWFLARMAAGAVTTLAGRCVTGRGGQNPRRTGWDVATLTLSFGALLLLLAGVLGIVG